MLLSMTGFGAARHQEGPTSVAVEIRTVNNRYLKCSLRLPDSLSPHEANLERAIRTSIARGTVSVSVRVDEFQNGARYEINEPLVQGLADQAGRIAQELKLPRPGIEGLLALPGMIIERSTSENEAERLWPIVDATLREALEKLNAFRHSEGAAMAADLLANLAIIEREVDAVAETAPTIVVEYRDRLLERVRELIDKAGASVDNNDIIREVSLFADRCDINEEITRLRSHISQFRSFLEDQASQGRKLDFLTQELNREVNTIGSKANNVAIAHRVVDMKAAIEKIREILQNIE